MTRRPSRPAERATDREVGVVAAVLVAGSEKAAAHRLGLSHSTVKHHLRNAHTKVGATTTAQLEGEDPLATYGDLAAAALRRLDQIEHVGDIAVVSLFDPGTGEIAAFEELIGAHGGLGGAQTRPFLLYPSDWQLDQGPIVGAPAVYRQLRHWMEEHLGMHFGPRTTV